MELKNDGMFKLIRGKMIIHGTVTNLQGSFETRAYFACVVGHRNYISMFSYWHHRFCMLFGLRAGEEIQTAVLKTHDLQRDSLWGSVTAKRGSAFSCGSFSMITKLEDHNKRCNKSAAATL